VTILTTIVEKELNWRFRRNHQEDDFGIDGYVDIVQEGGAIVGKCFAVQIKTGPSHIVKSPDQGMLLYGERKHLNYFLNSPIPVVLVWVDDSRSQAWWVHVKPAAIRMTSNGWSILIPKSNRFDSSGQHELARLAGLVKDYLPWVERIQKIREMACDAERVIFLATKVEATTCDVSRLKQFFEMFEAAPDMLPRLQGKLILAVQGWNDDKREVYEIPEARKWFANAEQAVLGWGYYLDLEASYTTFHTFFLCTIPTKIIGIRRTGKLLDVSRMDGLKFIKKHFSWLNEFAEKHGFSADVNKQISMQMGKAMKSWFLTD